MRNQRASGGSTVLVLHVSFTYDCAGVLSSFWPGVPVEQRMSGDPCTAHPLRSDNTNESMAWTQHGPSRTATVSHLQHVLNPRPRGLQHSGRLTLTQGKHPLTCAPADAAAAATPCRPSVAGPSAPSESVAALAGGGAGAGASVPAGAPGAGALAGGGTGGGPTAAAGAGAAAACGGACGGTCCC